MTASAEPGGRRRLAAAPAPSAQTAPRPSAAAELRGRAAGPEAEPGSARCGPRCSLDLAELVAVAEDEVHVLIEGLEGADEDAPVLQDAPHAVVDVLQHLAALSHRLQETALHRTPGRGGAGLTAPRPRGPPGRVGPLAARTRPNARLTMAAAPRAPSSCRRRRYSLPQHHSLRRKLLRVAPAASARPHAAAPPVPRTALSGARWTHFRGWGRPRGELRSGPRPRSRGGGCRAPPRHCCRVPSRPVRSGGQSCRERSSA